MSLLLLCCGLILCHTVMGEQYSVQILSNIYSPVPNLRQVSNLKRSVTNAFSIENTNENVNLPYKWIVDVDNIDELDTWMNNMQYLGWIVDIQKNIYSSTLSSTASSQITSSSITKIGIMDTITTTVDSSTSDHLYLSSTSSSISVSSIDTSILSSSVSSIDTSTSDGLSFDTSSSSSSSLSFDTSSSSSSDSILIIEKPGTTVNQPDYEIEHNLFFPYENLDDQDNDRAKTNLRLSLFNILLTIVLYLSISTSYLQYLKKKTKDMFSFYLPSEEKPVKQKTNSTMKELDILYDGSATE